MRTGLWYDGAMAAGGDASTCFGEILDQIALADDLGFDTAWIAERHFTEGGCPSPQTLVGAIAARTEAIRIGALKTLPLDHPIRVAEDLAVLDLVSNGRILLGVTDGDEAREFGPSRTPFGERWERFTEAVELIRLAWTQDPFAYAGRFTRFPATTPEAADGPRFRCEPWRADETVPWRRGGTRPSHLAVFPKPAQIPHPPLWIGSTHAQAIEFAARHGLPVLAHSAEPLDAVRERFARYRAALRAADGQPTYAEYPVVRDVFVAESEGEARGLAEAGGVRGAESALVGNPDEIAAHLRRYRAEAGMNHILCRVPYPSLGQETLMRMLRLFQAEVWPRVQA